MNMIRPQATVTYTCPGRTEQWYRLDVSTILRGVEGKWFRASKLWEGVARPLIAGAEVTVLSIGPTILAKVLPITPSVEL